MTLSINQSISSFAHNTDSNDFTITLLWAARLHLNVVPKFSVTHLQQLTHPHNEHEQTSWRNLQQKLYVLYLTTASNYSIKHLV